MDTVVTSASGPVDPQLQQEVEAIDQSLRQSFAGLDLDTVRAEVEASLEHLDVSVASDVVAAWATAIRDRTDVELRLD